MINGKFFVLMLIALPAVIAQYKYCNQTLCPSGANIACKPTAFSSICVNPKIVQIDQGLRDLIVNKHNIYRNQMARGFLSFPRASHMGLMEWNEELADLAELNVRQCKMKHDCHNTNNFPKSGQNLAMSWSDQNPNVTQNVIDGLEGWFNEYKICPVDVIDELYNPYTNDTTKQVFHFTAMIQEKSTRVGCAALTSALPQNLTQTIFACNYAYTNMMGSAVYGKRCNSTHPIYTNLCSASEIYKFN